MKKLFLFAAVICFANISFAQSEKYTSAMKANISMLDSIALKSNAAELSNNFERIADAEKTLWLPYYYAAYCTAMQARMSTDNSKNDAIADKAQQLLDKAEAILGKENSETDVIKSIIATTRMTVDPQSRYMTYGPQIATWIEKAKNLDPTNPRPYLIEAENTFFTPEQFGGGQKAAKPMFDKATTLYAAFKPETELSPNWGGSSLQYFLSQYK